MEPTRFGLLVGGEPPFESATKCAELGLRADKDGYDSLWMPDHLIDIEGSKADPWTALGYVAAITKKIQFYTAVTDYQKVHPSKLAQILATLDELSGGRANLGLGAGEAMNLVPFGIPWDSVSTRVQGLEEYIEVLRLLWKSTAKAPVSYRGDYYSLRDAWLDQEIRRTPRICIGALSSARMLRTVGKYGDGWLPWLITAEMYKTKVSIIKREAEEAGRDPEAIDYVYVVPIVVSSDPKVIEENVKSFKVAIMTVGRYLVEAENVKLPEPETEINFQRLTVSSRTVEELMRLSEYVPTSLVQKVVAMGSPDDVIGFIEERLETGVTHVVLSLTKGNPEENLRVASERILPYFRDLMR